MIAGKRCCRGGSESGMRRQRAVGTRNRIMSHLASAGDVRAEAELASTVLAGEVGYPGSSIAFAQLLSGIERCGLIGRGGRGTRTYRISLAGEARAHMAAVPPRPAR